MTLERIKVHGAALEGNLEGNAADRDVLVVLPRPMRRRNRVVSNTFEIYPGTPTSKVADCFQNHVLPFCSRILCVEKGYR